MKKNTTKAGSTSANPTAFLLPLDADGFTRILETINGETPDDFTNKQASRRIEAAHRRAWCEVTEAAAANPAKLAEVTAQRKLSSVLDDLMPAIALRNQTVADATEQRGFLSYLKDEAEPIETEAATLKARDARINSQGEMPNVESMRDEINRIEYYLAHGAWKTTSLDFREAEFEKGLSNLLAEGKYIGELSKDAAEQRLKDLAAQIEETQFKVENHLDSRELHRLNELETKLTPIREEIAAAQDKASTMEAAAAAATADLKVRIEAAGIIGRAIIQACHIQTDTAAAA
jgi:hypothetical protein